MTEGGGRIFPQPVKNVPLKSQQRVHAFNTHNPEPRRLGWLEPCRMGGTRHSGSVRSALGITPIQRTNTRVRVSGAAGGYCRDVLACARMEMGARVSALEPAQSAGDGLYLHRCRSGPSSARDGRPCGLPVVLAARLVRNL